MIKAILLDMGGVALNGKIEQVLEKLARHLGIDAKHFSQFYSKYKPELQSGKMKTVDFCNLVKNEFNIQEDIIPIWTKTYLEVMTLNNPLLDFIRELRGKYQVGVITNTIDLHAAINRKRDAFKHFDEVIVSCDAGLVKPNRGIFDLMLKKLSVKGEECVLIDDRENHVQVARKIGMHGLIFKTLPELKRDLEKVEVEV